MAACEGCGEELVDGRSVCARCGFLNRAAPDPAATPDPAPVPGPVAPPLGTTGWGAPVAPRPAKRSSRPALLVIVVLAALAAGAVAFLVTRDESGSDDAADRVTCTGTAPAPSAAAKDRKPYETGSVSWTMSGPAERDVPDEPVSDGSIPEGEVWTAEVPGTDDLHAEMAMVITVDDDANLTETAERLVVNLDGTVVGEVEPEWIGGRCGRVVLGAGSGRAGDGWARFGLTRVGDQMVVVGYVWVSEDRTEGEQGFADLLASVRIEE